MRNLSSKLWRPLRRSSKSRSEDESGTAFSAGKSGGLSYVQSETTREKHGLFELVSGRSDHEFSLDIVAVHGLSGDWESTWTDPDSKKLWLKDFVPSQFPNTGLRIWSFGYYSATAFTNSVADIDDAAKALINAVDGERQTKNSRTKPIIFIAHSLGGIIVKRAMNLANERSELWKHVVDSVCSILFFAVPHRGADAAYLATVAANVYRFATLGFSGNQNFVEALRRNSPVFCQISNAFIQPASKLKIVISFYETAKIGNNIIVDKGSASLALNQERAVPIQGANHRDICRFFSENSQKYRAVRNALRDIVELALNPEGTHDQENAFLDALCFPDMLRKLGYNHDSESYQWLYRNNTFENWNKRRDGPRHSRLLWVTGAPGCGKSTAIQGAFHQMLDQQDVREGTHQLAVFFFDDNDSDDSLLRNPNGMYRTLLYQVLKSQRDIIRRVIQRPFSNVLGGRGQGTHQQAEYDYRGLLLDTLRDNCQHTQFTTIFIDALDECLGKQSLDLDRFFHEIVHSDDFSNLNICVSSRHLEGVRWLWLGQLNTSQLESPFVELRSPMIEVERENYGAISTYLDERLRMYKKDAPELVGIKEEIQNMSLGIFVWVVSITDRVVEDLRKTRPGQLDIRLRPIPSRLKKLYSDVLRGAEDRAKTWRFFQWLLLAPDLSLRAWRDLIPFLQEEPPRSLKKSRNSKDWATGLNAFIGDDSWIQDLQQIGCRISCGLAQVARVSDMSSERPDKPVSDRLSVTGEAGSWYTADGDKRIVRPIHESVRQFFQHEDGFAILDSTLADQNGQGLIMAMLTCLDFIRAREFSTFMVSTANQVTPESENSSASLVSDGDGPAWTSISRFSSARSIRHKTFSHRARSHPYKGNESLSSTEDSGLENDRAYMDGDLVQPNQDAEGYSECFHNDRLKVDHWRNVLEEPLHLEYLPSPVIGPPLQLSGQEREREIWYSELLSYILTAFPAFASSAEAAGVDSSLVIVKLCEGRLWQRWICLSEDIAAETSLKQWAESQKLNSWMRYLTRTGENHRTRENFYTPSRSGNEDLTRDSRSFNNHVTLNYCFDGGRRFVNRLESLNAVLPTKSGLDNDLVAGPASESLLGILEDRLRSAVTQNDLGGERSSFIPYRMLRFILTDAILATLLEEETGIAPEKARKIRQSYIKICGVLILIQKIPYMKQILDMNVDDKCLPLRLHRPHGEETVVLMSKIPGQTPAVLKGMTANESRLIEEFQWWFLSPFLAKPAGRLQHYKLGSAREPIPVIQQRSAEEDRATYTPDKTRFEKELETRVRFHPDSFDFGAYGVGGETSGSSQWFLLRRLQISWKRFLSIVYSLKMVGERGHDGASESVPLLCTIERPNPESPFEIDYYLVFPCQNGNLSDLTSNDLGHFQKSGQLTDRWLASQCYNMAASLWAIHRIAALKMPHIPQMQFLGSGRLASDVIYWLSSSGKHLGTLAISDHNSRPPEMFESAPEYYVHQEDVTGSALHLEEGLLDETSATLGLYKPAYVEPRREHVQPRVWAPIRVRPRKVDAPLAHRSRYSRHHIRDDEPVQEPTDVISQTPLGCPGRRPTIQASRFHVWCLGVVWLELITWYILGLDGALEFKQKLAHVNVRGKTAKSGFFEEAHVDDADGSKRTYRLRYVVSEWIERLQTHQRCTDIVRNVLVVIAERMLVVDVAARASSREIMEKLEGIKKREEETSFR